jgi:hypothetical protein
MEGCTGYTKLVAMETKNAFRYDVLENILQEAILKFPQLISV